MSEDITEKMRVIRNQIINEKLNRISPEKIPRLASQGVDTEAYILHWNIPNERLMGPNFEEAYIRMVENAVLDEGASVKLGVLVFEGELKDKE